MAVPKGKLKPTREPEKYRTITGVDSSSQSLAWSTIHEGQVVDMGSIDIHKLKTMQDRLKALGETWHEWCENHETDHLFIEKSIYVKNPGTFRTLSYIVGGIMTTSLAHGIEVTDVDPSTWKAFYGYTSLPRKFVLDAKKKLGPSEGSALCERLRKSQTAAVLQHNFPNLGEFELFMSDHNVADATGIAVYGFDLLSEKLEIEKSKAIALPLDELLAYGLTL
jgi:Holliday junction resolvasome RuvABC endonuclease subunit